MLSLYTLVASSQAVADTLHKEILAQKIQTLSQMSTEELTSMVIKWVLNLSARVLIALAIFFIGRWIIRYLRKLLRRMMERRAVEASLKSFLLNLVSITLTLFLIIVIIGILGIDTTSFVAIFASAGLAIGMALSGTLQNFAGGVMILIFKPFRVGDFIEAQGQTGTVKEIQLFNTVINTTDNKTIMIPNGGISTGIINNYSKESIRRVEWTFGIGYRDDYDLAKATIASMLDQDARVLKDPAYFIAVSSLGDSSVNIVVRAWTSTGDFWSVFFDMNEKVYKQFPIVGLNIPYPQMDVHLHQEGH